MLQALGNSSLGIYAALGIGRALPPVAGRALSRAVGRAMAADPRSELARVARANQWVASGGTLAGAALDDAVRANATYMARFQYDFYHVLGRERAERQLVVIDETFERVLRDEREGAFVYVGVHFGNFDLLGRMLGHHGWRMQVLSVADPTPGYRMQNRFREQLGFELTPVTVESLKHAARGLAEGRSVLTGIDRPLPEPPELRPRFFGRPAALPLLHVRLAMRVGVPVVVFAGVLGDDGRYRLVASQPVVIERARPSDDAVLANAERCLAEAERIIRLDPAQWVMPHRVWPDVEPPA